jgi:hypothetical protein
MMRQTEIHNSRVTSAAELEMAIKKLKRYKSPGIDQIPAKFIKSGVRPIRSEIHEL